MITFPLYNIINNTLLGDDMKLKDINTSVPFSTQKQMAPSQKKKRDAVPNSGALFKAVLDKEKAK